MLPKKNLIGQKFGRLLVLKDLGRTKHNKISWLCLCDCGRISKPSTGDLIKGNSTSCGCIRREKASIWLKEYRTKHNGHYRHGDAPYGKEAKLYKIWRNMKTRCYNPNSKAYKRYGNRGIFVYKTWKDDYVIFKNWALKNGYKEGLTIDRIDNDGNYFPSNCRFITKSENSRLGARIGR